MVLGHLYLYQLRQIKCGEVIARCEEQGVVWAAVLQANGSGACAAVLIPAFHQFIQRTWFDDSKGVLIKSIQSGRRNVVKNGIVTVTIVIIRLCFGAQTAADKLQMTFPAERPTTTRYIQREAIRGSTITGLAYGKECHTVTRFFHIAADGHQGSHRRKKQYGRQTNSFTHGRLLSYASSCSSRIRRTRSRW